MSWQSAFTPLDVHENDTLPSLMLTHLNSWAAITVTGDDRKSYLQGQITCDVVTLAEDKSTLGAHCDAKGKVWSIFRLFAHQNGYAMVQPRSAIETELAEIKKYAVFSKVDITLSESVMFGVIGQEAEQYIDALSESTGDVRNMSFGTAVKISELRWLLMVDKDKVTSICETTDAKKVSEDLWRAFDIKEGLPIIGKDAQNEYIPQAFNLQALDGISFEKGCYTGQEMVARAKYRGINKRGMFIVKGKLNMSITESSVEMERSVGENWRKVGTLLSHYQYVDGTVIGTIVLPNNLDPDTQLRASSSPEETWTIQPLPYAIDDE
ncbi:tRNA-modifying protein YgfZ [Vibrio sp. S4M6]|uniref:tRNA-modifying protein YgfZ n=1 Tax=Vibrio sinus TaxID=2946865 RepID=UPI002029FCAA|nr:tRNA-modifying protein YgfZ [Vibrio sinus]MCL9781531.1 tRNA-modifying protein YgfZ [Vibrio sinus]